jgi:hypothetical protein
VTRHIAHFNWATLVADLEDRRVAPFVNAVPKVNAIAERSPGFVWRSGDEAAKGTAIGWPLFTENRRLIASFSVWETPEHFRDYVYKTVHGRSSGAGTSGSSPTGRAATCSGGSRRGISPTWPRPATRWTL